ncbi:cytosolic phospholipase A2 epsilon [Cricetulus griseus]|nr:cytosolic phospholipase A2 epsilon [Cricetulus griseus]
MSVCVSTCRAEMGSQEGWRDEAEAEKIERRAMMVSQTDCFVTLWLPTASQEKLRTRTISNCLHPQWDESFTFQIQTQVKNVLELSVCDEDTLTPNDHLLTVLYDLSKLCLRNKTHVKFPLNPEGMEELEVEFLLAENPNTLDVRLGFSLCQEEVEFLQKRKVVVTKALSQVLQLEEDLHEDEVGAHVPVPLEMTTVVEEKPLLFPEPVNLPLVAIIGLCTSICCFGEQVPLIAIMATGGGARSMVALYGHLMGLQKLNLLDCSTYITGLSGATWTMATLYSDAEWSSKNLEPAVFEARRHVVKDKMPALYPDQLCKWREELHQHNQEGYKTTLTDFWGKLIEYSLGDKKNDCKLSEQRAALCQGQNPLPIYLTINVKDDVSNQDFREWFEFSPYEVGMQKYGAFIPTELFGSEFFMGRLMKRIPEPEMCYMLGLWSSIFSLNLLDAWNLSHTSEEFYYRWIREKHHDIEDDPLLPEIPRCNDASPLETRVVIPASWLSNTFREILTHRSFVSEFHNFLYGMQLHTDYLQNKQFSMWKDTVLDTFPNQLTQFTKHLNLLDTAFFVNSSYAPLLRPERKIDLIIHLNYCAGSQTKASTAETVPSPAATESVALPQRPEQLYIFKIQPLDIVTFKISEWPVRTPGNQAPASIRLTETTPVSQVCLQGKQQQQQQQHRRGFCPLKQTCEYCTTQNIPFPSYSIQEDDKSLKECYLMENPQEPDTPIVAYFPLINDTFQKYKAPGVERSPEELEQGQLNIYGPKSPYATKELTYTEAAFDKLVKLTEYNILNNKDKLIQAVRLAVEKKRMNRQCPS